MTNKELIKIIEIAIAEVEWDYPLDYQIAFDEAIEIIKRMDKLSEVLTEAEQLHPYKILGDPDTYTQYNEGWNDALDYIDSKMGYVMTTKLRFTNHKNHRDILKEYYYHNKYILTEQMKDTLLDAIECMEYVIEKG